MRSNASVSRTILHLDMDAFYASVEVLDDPSLKGKPVIVAGGLPRGVVLAASYPSRRFGVRSAMPTATAKRLCPQGIYVPPRFERYTEVSQRVMDIFRQYTPLVEPLSLDEAFLDVTQSRALHGSGREIAAAIKARVREELGLSVSAGISEVKFAAKIATDLGKPDGLVEVPEGRVRAFLEPLPVGRLWGVGPKTEAVLTRLKLSTIGDVARSPPGQLEHALGPSHGAHLRSLALGEDPREVIPDDPHRTVGAEETFDADIQGREAIGPHLLAQAVRVARRLRAEGLRGRTVTVKLKYADFTLVTRRCTLEHPTDDDRAIYQAALAQLERADVDRPIRLTGVSVGGFGEPPDRRQLGLFDAAEPAPEEERRRRALNAARDAISERFGDDALKPATLADKARRR
jgi:DNA polymerase-4